MNNQTETPPPDFGFILNQAQPPENKPKSKKTTILVSVAVALVVLTAGLYAFIPKSTQTPTSIPSIGTADSGSLLKEFKSRLQANQPTEAFALLSSDYQTKQNLETFQNYFVTVMNKNVKLDSCVDAVIADPTQSNVLQTTCQMARGEGKITFTLTTKSSTDNGKDKVTINDITWKLDDKVAVSDVQ